MSQFRPAAHSVAGHEGTLTDTDNVIFAKKSTAQEREFYENMIDFDQKRQLEAEDTEFNVGDLLTDWMPQSFGTLSENAISADEVADIDKIAEKVQFSSDHLPALPKSDNTYLVLSNLCKNFSKPSIMDIKLGLVLTDDTVTEEKRLRLQKVSELTTSGTLSFRLCGMKLYSKQVPDLTVFETSKDATNPFNGDQVVPVEEEGESYVKFDKFFGRSLTPTTIKDAIKLYIGCSVNKQTALHFVDMFWKRLVVLYNCLLDYEVRIVSGSLLFVIENDIPANIDLNVDRLIYEDSDDESDEEEDTTIRLVKQLSSLNLIDFAHAKLAPGQGPDENILKGVENLKDIFEQIREEMS